VVTTNPKEHRLQRLATQDPADNRISYDCINVPAAFYKAVVAPAFTGMSGIVYILPEVRPIGSVFPGLPAVATRYASGQTASWLKGRKLPWSMVESCAN
jgi:hypothetical protein